MSDKIYRIVTEQIIKQLEQVNTADYNQPWFCVGHSPVNLRGTAYRGINHLLLSHSGYQSNIWGTFKQWKEKDCSVRKGERSQMVVLWKFFDEADEEGNSTGKTSAVMTRYYRVFNSEQVDGEHARTVERKFKDKLLDHDPIAEAQSFVDGYMETERLPLRNSDRAYYSAGVAEYIAMPELGQFRSPEHFYSVYCHEITHSVGNVNRLNRDLSGKFGSEKYAFEELVAELGSAMICGSLGLEQKPREDHAQYIKGWLTRLRSDHKFIIQAASKAQKAADYALESAARANKTLATVAAE
ncbi:MAG: ArdC family protein [Nitrospinales bacterium]